MDFRSLTRRELQTLCKMNNIPANMTNVAMADALESLDIVVGIEEFMAQPPQSENAESSLESPTRSEIRTPYVPPTGGRSTRRKNVVKEDPETAKPAIRSTRCKNVESVDSLSQSESSQSLLESPTKSEVTSPYVPPTGGRSTRRKNVVKEDPETAKPTTRTRPTRKAVMFTPAPLGATNRSTRVKDDSAANRAYGTRRSTRLAKNEGLELFNEEVVKESNAGLEVSGINGVEENSTLVENMEEYESECVSLQEKIDEDPKLEVKKIEEAGTELEMAESELSKEEVVSEMGKKSDEETGSKVDHDNFDHVAETNGGEEHSTLDDITYGYKAEVVEQGDEITLIKDGEEGNDHFETEDPKLEVNSEEKKDTAVTDFQTLVGNKPDEDMELDVGDIGFDEFSETIGGEANSTLDENIEDEYESQEGKDHFITKDPKSDVVEKLEETTKMGENPGQIESMALNEKVEENEATDKAKMALENCDDTSLTLMGAVQENEEVMMEIKETSFEIEREVAIEEEPMRLDGNVFINCDNKENNLHEMSMRKLSKMLKEKLQISNRNNEEARPALAQKNV